ncbi:carbohydrate phosphorylase family protein, partial [Chlamydia psittaci 84-8471/1]
YVILAWMHY